MDVDLPDVVAEVTAKFERYEQALVSNDVAVLDGIFRDDPRSIRYGGGENLYGYREIEAFRAARSPVGLARTISKTVITTYGRDFAVASTFFTAPPCPGKSVARCRPGCVSAKVGAWLPRMSASLAKRQANCRTCVASPPRKHAIRRTSKCPARQRPPALPPKSLLRRGHR